MQATESHESYSVARSQLPAGPRSRRQASWIVQSRLLLLGRLEVKNPGWLGEIGAECFRTTMPLGGASGVGKSMVGRRRALRPDVNLTEVDDI